MAKVYAFLGLLLFFGYAALGQPGLDGRYGPGWAELETRVRNAYQLEGTDQLLATVAETARQQKDYISWARALWDRMIIRDRKTEDSLYFKNSAFLDSLLTAGDTLAGGENGVAGGKAADAAGGMAGGTPKELLPLLHLMQAERLVSFAHRGLRFNRAMYETPAQFYNYAAMPPNVFDSVIGEHFRQAKVHSPLLDTAQPQDLLWLSTSPQTFLIKPVWLDIAHGDEIDYLLTDYQYGNDWRGGNSSRGAINGAWAGASRNWLGLSPAAFIDTLNREANNIAIAPFFLEWLKDRSRDPHAYYFIEAITRKSLYQNYLYDTAATTLYESSLLVRTRDTLPEVRAFAVYQLCISWSQQNSQEEEWQLQGYGGYSRLYNLSTSRHTPGSILRLYADNREFFTVYPLLGKSLESMRARILQARMRVTLSREQLPDEGIDVTVNYKNTLRFYYEIVRVAQREAMPGTEKGLYDYLLSRPAIRDSVTGLDLADDHAVHQQRIKLNGLAPGKYYLVFSDTGLTQRSSLTAAVEFDVSGLVVLHTDDNAIHVLNNRSGFPVAGAKLDGIEVNSTKNQKNEKILVTNLTNEKGFAELNKENIDLAQASLRGDTAVTSYSIGDDAVDPTDEKTKEDALDFYEDHLRIFLFTDRSIYRPGQMVHYKAILTTSNIRTADPMLFTRRNLKTGAGKEGLETWLQDKKPLLYLNDPNSRGTDSAAIRPDDYGSFAGSFVIPKDAETGNWELSTDHAATGGRFRVEEYKRPTFEIEVLSPEKTYLIGEPAEFKIRARSFTGASMANTMIRYNVTKGGLRLADSTAMLDADGAFTIHVDDTAAGKHPQPDSVIWQIQYSLSLTATDLTGESHDAESRLNVSNRPVNIHVPDRAVYLLSDSPIVNIETFDINRLRLAKVVTVGVYKKKFSDSGEEEGRDLVYTTTINTGNFEKLHLAADHWRTGEYEIELECREQGHLLGKKEVKWTVLDQHSSEWPIVDPFLLHLSTNVANRGESFRFYTGSRFDSGYTLTNIKYYAIIRGRLTPVSIFLDKETGRGIQAWNWVVPKDAGDRVLITSMMVRHGDIYRKSSWVMVNIPWEQPVIRIERFREHLSPGETTKFSVSVRTGSSAVAAQVMSTIYDASLDRLEPHRWGIPSISTRPEPHNGWPYELNSQNAGFAWGQLPADRLIAYKALFSWANDFQQMNGPGTLEGRVAGLSITSSNSLNDVVVIGYGSTKRSLSNAIINIRGTNSFPSMDKQVLVILDGVEYKDDLKRLNPQMITQAIVLNGAEATALYGSRAAHGVLLLSTKGEIKLPGSAQEPVVRIRKNFNETAFFSPAIGREGKGVYSFVFTVPESVTEWMWKIMGHTKNALFAYAEKKFDTRLPLMIQPHLPRFVYQGDRIILKSRISNLDTVAMQGQASCSVEDVVTGEDLTSRMLDKSSVSFSAAGSSNASAAFAMHVPLGLMHPVKIIIKAITAGYADAEEHELPVLSTRVLVRRAVSFDLAQKRDTVFGPGDVDAGDSLLGIGVGLTAPPQAALLNALPWLAGYSYDCAEQTFNKMLAHITALELMRSDKDLQEDYARSTKDTVDERRQPDEPALRSMPWLDLTGKTARQQKQLRSLLDTVRTIAAIETYLSRLYGLQKPNGGVAWFDNGESDPYISSYLLAGFGRLRKEAWRPVSPVAGKLDGFLSSLVRYCDGFYSTNPDLHYLYARMFWLDLYPISDRQRVEFKSFITRLWENKSQAWLYDDAMLIISSLSYFDPGDAIYKKALDQLESIRQLAIPDETNGVRWKALADNDDLTTSSEETISMLCEAFERSPGYPVMRTGILKWLMGVQADHHWSSTKATAAVIDLLKQDKGSVAGVPASLTAAFGHMAYSLSAGGLQGSPFVYVPGASTVRLSGHASGHVIRYYFTSPDRLQGLDAPVKLRKNLFRYIDSSRVWEPLAGHPVVRVADRIKVVLTLETGKPLRYVYIDDKRAASFEPLDTRSGYSYSSGFPLYRSVRDAGCQFFCDFIPSGRWEISYEVRAEHEGEFSSGAAMLQCMYKPEVSAYSLSGGVEVMPQQVGAGR